ncbi:MAG: hypothetical protein HG456_002780 [candidate division SR1 bacterium]|nr:hypothetical protein [candidate division SR1 bacterium]
MKKIGFLSSLIFTISILSSGCAIYQESSTHQEKTMQLESSLPILTGMDFDDYPITGALLLYNSDEMILISGSEVNYDNKFNFEFSEGLNTLSYTNQDGMHHFILAPLKKDRGIFVRKNFPYGIEEFCTQGRLFDSEAPDQFLTGRIEQNGKELMHMNATFGSVVQDLYCFTVGKDYYGIQLTSFDKQENAQFLEGLKWLN